MYITCVFFVAPKNELYSSTNKGHSQFLEWKPGSVYHLPRICTKIEPQTS